MGRPTKENLGYFSCDTDMRRDDKIALSLATSSDGMKLFGTYVALLQDIYHNNYHMKFTEENAILFCQPFNDLSVETFWDILDTLLERGLFSKELYEEKKILTSRSIQERYLKGCERRKEVRMREDLILIEDVDNFIENQLAKNYAGEKLNIKVVNAGNNAVSDGNNKVVDDNNSGNEENVDNDEEDLELYNLEKEYMWKESSGQEIDFEAVLDYWNNVNGAQARMTDPKKPDVRRALREYTGIEIARGLYVRAKDEHIGKYKTQWSTFFGQKTLKNMDKWVDKAHNLRRQHNKMQGLDAHLDSGWYMQKDATEIAEEAGMPLEDPVFWKTKKVDSTLLYYPKFDE